MRYGRMGVGRYKCWPAMLATALLVSGCGGGGGGSTGTVVVANTPTPTPTPTATTPAATAEQVEAERSNAATVSKADAAYRVGATGRGIGIAIIDTGIVPTLSEFAGRIDPASANLGSDRGLIDLSGHGTAMASIAAAARDGRGIHGLAYDASIVSLNATRPDKCKDFDCPAQSDLVIAAIDAAIAARVRVINMSFNVDQTTEPLVAAVRRAAAAGIVMVISAGNESASQPLLLSRSFVEAGSGHVIIVGGIDASGRPYRSGNAAGGGAAAASYLMALGVDVNMLDRNGLVIAQSGTSASAAVVSGAVALIAQARPKLTGAQIVTLLLNNATDLGDPGRDATYGNGALNIAAVLAASAG
ncbi:S8 family serine peptidase [Sphingomonas hankookensis]|uniref:S8 family serine peptidase n=1 Tax=Sphingomonas hankookensis TaxID=563996 RepID=UPI001F55C5FC|nr:S8 family serine peptidase [Sphingomonas hankookensis]